MDFDRNSIGVKIAFFRNKRNLTQRRLGQKAGISESEISKYEQHTNIPKMDALQKIADILEINIDQLLEDNLEIFQQQDELKQIDRDLLSQFYLLSNRKMSAFLRFINTLPIREQRSEKLLINDSTFTKEVVTQIGSLSVEYQEYFLNQIIEMKKILGLE